MKGKFACVGNKLRHHMAYTQLKLHASRHKYPCIQPALPHRLAASQTFSRRIKECILCMSLSVLLFGRFSHVWVLLQTLAGSTCCLTCSTRNRRVVRLFVGGAVATEAHPLMPRTTANKQLFAVVGVSLCLLK